MNTLATRKQSEAIRDRMRSIRSDLPYTMDDARDDLKQLSDWKYYVRRLPLTSVAIVATACYLAVPKKQMPREMTSQNSSYDPQPVAEEAAESSFAGGLLGAVAAMALRTATSLAINRVSHSLMSSTRHHN